MSFPGLLNLCPSKNIGTPPLGWAGSIFVGANDSQINPHMLAGRVERGGGTDTPIHTHTDRQRDAAA